MLKVPFYKFSSISSSHYFSINAQEDSIIYFGTNIGLVAFYPYKKTNYQNKYNTFIRRIFLNDSLFFAGALLENKLDKRTSFDYENNNIIFEYSSAFYEDADKNLYRYRLIGEDTTWSEWNEYAKKEYTNLWEGKYVFEVQAKNIYENIGKTAKFNFKIKAPIYRTYVAYFIYIILLVLFIWLIVKVNIQRLIKQKDRLEKIVLERTEEIRMQKEEIEVQNENLQQQKEEITAQAEELLSKNEIIEKAYNNIKLLSEIGKEVTSNLEIKNIIKIVYDNVNTLMDASVFAIGIYNSEKNRIEFDGAIEKSKNLEFHYDDVNNKKQLSVICFDNQKEIIINNLLDEYQNYFDQEPKAIAGDIPNSLIYLPLINKETKIGVITIQSFKINAYNEYHLNILQNIATYTAIALENADAYRQINSQKNIIEMHSEAIRGSIRYAQTIQNAILPRKEKIDKYFENFIIFRPKDIVSGDFYWYSYIENYHFIADIDCTGHGVPGAFMSMIGNTLLNEIVNGKKIVNTADILTKLHQLIIVSLRQQESENNDGMDVCLCRLEKKDTYTEVFFTGAKRPLLVYKNGYSEVESIKGNRKSIGGTQKKLNQEEFVANQIIFETGGIIYLSSDGFTDQNNPERKKFGSQQLTDIIINNVNKTMPEQAFIYNKALEQWMNGEEQRDDISLIGIKI